MTRLYDIVTFDCYGTLIDWDRGIVDAFADAVAAHGGNLDERRALETYERVDPIVEAEGYRSYREVLTESVRRVARELGWALPESRAGFLAESLPSWPPFPDTNAALERLARAGFRLRILSNGDDDLLPARTRQEVVVHVGEDAEPEPRACEPLQRRVRVGERRPGGQALGQEPRARLGKRPAKLPRHAAHALGQHLAVAPVALGLDDGLHPLVGLQRPAFVEIPAMGRHRVGEGVDDASVPVDQGAIAVEGDDVIESGHRRVRSCPLLYVTATAKSMSRSRPTLSVPKIGHSRGAPRGARWRHG